MDSAIFENERPTINQGRMSGNVSLTKPSWKRNIFALEPASAEPRQELGNRVSPLRRLLKIQRGIEARLPAGSYAHKVTPCNSQSLVYRLPCRREKGRERAGVLIRVIHTEKENKKVKHAEPDALHFMKWSIAMISSLRRVTGSISRSTELR